MGSTWYEAGKWSCPRKVFESKPVVDDLAEYGTETPRKTEVSKKDDEEDKRG